MAMDKQQTTNMVVVIFAGLYVLAQSLSCYAKETEVHNMVGASSFDAKHTKNMSNLKISEQTYDTLKMQKYQTFDEFSLQGLGVVQKWPYVFVDKKKDTLVVVSSYEKDSVRIYTNMADNLWYSHMEYDMDKRGEEAYHSKKCRLARTYDRYLYNDTILDIKTSYIQWEKFHTAYVRTKEDLHILRLHDVDNILLSNISNLRHYAFEQCKKDEGYRFKVTENSYSYIGDGDDNYYFQKKAYGLWGTLPGIEETFLYMGIDIREYSDNLKDFQKKNPDYVYRYSDELPSFPNGTIAFRKFVKKKIKRSLFVKDENNDRVKIKVVIEKDGSITNPVIVEGIDQLHNEDAMNIVRQMPKWIPAQLNGSPIRFSELIQIPYNKSYL